MAMPDRNVIAGAAIVSIMPMPRHIASTISTGYMSNPAHLRAAHMPNSAKPIRPNAIISFSRSYLSCTTPPGSRNTDDIRVMIESSSVACAGEPVTVCAMSGSAKPWILDDSDVHESATNHLPSAATVMFRCPNPHHSVEVRGLQITPSISRAIACFAG